MKNIITLLIFLTVSYTSSSQTKLANSLLWKVSGKEMTSPSYIFGTIHLICKDDYIWTEQMQNAINKADEVCMEMDMDDPAIIWKVASGMIDRTGKQLKEYFSDSDYKLVHTYYLDSLGINITTYASMKPIVLQTLITSNTEVCDSTVSYEIAISKYAKGKGLNVSGLETAEEQIKLLDKIPTDSIINSIINFVKGDHEELEDYFDMIDAYKTQNLERLHQLIMKAKKEGDDMNAFLDERNKLWIDRIVDKMEQKPTFFAVGAGHLLGDNGLINLLKSEGYTLTPIK